MKAYVTSSAVKRSIGFTTGFHNHGEGPYWGLLHVLSELTNVLYLLALVILTLVLIG